MKKIRRRFDIGFYILAFILIDLNAFFIYIAIKQSDPVMTAFTVLSVLFTLGRSHAGKQDPDKVLWLWDWLE